MNHKETFDLLGTGLAALTINFSLEPSPEAGEELIKASESFFHKAMTTADKDIMHTAYALLQNNKRLVAWMHKGI